MNLDLKLLFVSAFLVSQAVAVYSEVQNSEDDNLVGNDEEIEKSMDGKANYKELMTFTYQKLRDEVEEEMDMENERRYQKALENKLAKLGLKKGDPGYDDVDVDYDEVFHTRLDTDPNYDYKDDEYIENEESPVQEKKDFHSMTPEERQMWFEKSLKKLIKSDMKENYDIDSDGINDSRTANMLKGLQDLLKVNGDSQVREEEHELATKYKGRKYEPTKEELKRIDDVKSNLKVSLSKLEKLQADASRARYQDW